MGEHSSETTVQQHTDQLSWEGTLFVNGAAWQADPRTAKIFYLEGDDELEDIADRESSLPLLAQENDVQYFLDFQVFDDVIIKQREVTTNSTIDDYILALDHYREYDSFYWPTPSRRI